MSGLAGVEGLRAGFHGLGFGCRIDVRVGRKGLWNFKSGLIERFSAVGVPRWNAVGKRRRGR